EPDRDCERAELRARVELLRHLEPRQRVTDAHLHTSEALELAGETREAGGATGDDDLADAERAGLVLVELERGDELARECLYLFAYRVDCERVLLGRDALGHDGGVERDDPLEGLDLGRCDVEGARDRDAQRRPSPLDYARELADRPVGDG